MQTSVVDLDYLYEISENDPVYIYEILGIFLDTMPKGLEKLEQDINEFTDWEAIYKQSHFLKSSVGIIKVKNMFECLSRIELLAKDKKGREEIEQLLPEILNAFKAAHPILTEEREKQKAKQS